MKHNLNTLKITESILILISVFTGIIEVASASSNIKVAEKGHFFEYGDEIYDLRMMN